MIANRAAIGKDLLQRRTPEDMEPNLGVENVASVLSLVKEIDKKALTYKVTPQAIDFKIERCKALSNPNTTSSLSASALLYSSESTLSRDLAFTHRRVQKAREVVGVKRAKSQIDLQGSLHNADIARQEASTILADFGISLTQPISNKSDLSLLYQKGIYSSNYEREKAEGSPTSIPRNGDGFSMLIDSGGSALWDDSSMLDQRQSTNFLVTGEETPKWGQGMSYTEEIATPQVNGLSQVNGSSLLETPSLSLPLIRTLGKSELSQISQMPKANELELEQFRSIDEKFISSEILPDDPYQRIKPNWRKYKYQGLLQGRSLAGRSVAHVRSTDSTNLHLKPKAIVTAASMPDLPTACPKDDIVTNTHSRLGLAPLEIQKRQPKRAATNHRGVHSSNRPSSSVLRPPSTTSQGDTIGFLGIPRNQLSQSSQDNSKVLRAHLDAARLREQKITSNLRLRLFRYRQKVPLAMQGPQGGMVRVAAILRAAQSRQIMQMRVKSFNLARRKREIAKKESSVKIQACWRRYTARSKYIARQRAKRIQAHEAWAQRVKDDAYRQKLSYRILSIFGMEPSLATDDLRRKKRWQRRVAKMLGLEGKIYISQSEQFRTGQEIVIRHKGHKFDFSRGEIMSKVKNHHTKAQVFLFDLSKVAEVNIEHIHVPKGFYQRLIRRKKAEMDADHLKSRSWFGMDINDKWDRRERFIYNFKKKRKLKRYDKEYLRQKNTKEEKLKLAGRQAERDGKTLEEVLPAETLATLRSPPEVGDHPKFFSPYNIRSWTQTVNSSLDLRDAAEWESSMNRESQQIVWRNVIDGEKRRCKPGVLVSTRDIIWRYTMGNIREFYRLRTIQGYQRIVWDHGGERSQLGEYGAAKKKQMEELRDKSNNGGGGLSAIIGEGDPLNEGLTEDDPDFVLPWAEEDSSSEPGKSIWVRRRKSDGEIIKSSDEIPDELLTKEERERKEQEARADELKQKEAKEKLIEMQVAKEKRAREKKMRQRRRKK